MGLNLEPVPENPAQKKKVAAILAAIAVVGLLFSGISRRWMSTPDPIDAGYGPRGWSCEPERNCGPFAGSKSNSEVVEAITDIYEMLGQADKAPSKMFPIAGWITLATIVIAALALAASAALALGRGIPIRPIAPTTVALLALFVALIAGCVFIATNPFRREGLSEVGVSWPFAVFGASVVLGIVAAQKLSKFKQADPNELAI